VQRCRYFVFLLLEPNKPLRRGLMKISDQYENRVLDIINSLESDLQSKALWLRGEQSYKEYPGYSINRVRKAKKQIRDLKNEV
jgi:hypothetical protein